jgi:hypothetical protein
MYHPGQVIEIFTGSDKNVQAADSSMQLMLEMWDENMITVGVDPHISKLVKKGDIVLVDYTTTKLIAVKILRGPAAKNSWVKYKEFYNKRKMPVSMPKQKAQHYMG